MMGDMKRALIGVAVVAALAACSSDAVEPEPAPAGEVAAAALEKHGEMLQRYSHETTNELYDQCSGHELGKLVSGAACDNAVTSMVAVAAEVLADIEGSDLPGVAKDAAIPSSSAAEWADNGCADIPLTGESSDFGISCGVTFVTMRIGMSLTHEALQEAAA